MTSLRWPSQDVYAFSVTLRHMVYGYDSDSRPFGQPAAWHLLVPARLELVKDESRYLLDSSASAEVVEQQPGRDLLTHFLRLARVDPESRSGAQRVLTFARKWGVLDICSHGLPGPTPPCCGVESRLRQPDPVSAYRGYARHLNGLCAVAQAIREGRRRRSEDWGAVAGAPIARGILDPLSDFRPTVEPLARLQLDRWPYVAMDPLLSRIGEPAAERAVVAIIVNRWLAVGSVQPGLDWSSEVAGFRLGGGHLVGALAQGILQAVSGQEGFVLCSVCGNPYQPNRQPRGGELRYCEECRGSRQRMRAHRERRRYEPGDQEGGTASSLMGLREVQ